MTNKPKSKPVVLPPEVTINNLHSQIAEGIQAAVQKAIDCGELLGEMKAQVSHGQWRGWINEHCQFSYRTAARYMKFYDNRDKIKEAKSIREAEAQLVEKERGHDSIAADLRRIKRDILKPVKVAKRRWKKLEYIAADDELEEIVNELRDEVEDFYHQVRDL